MVKNAKLTCLLEQKSKLYNELLVNIEKQKESFELDFELLISFQEEWLNLSNKINSLDKEIQAEITNNGPPLSAESQLLLQQLTQKAKKVQQFNKLAIHKSNVRLENIKKELDGVKLGQQTANAYKTITEITPTYIDRKS